MDNLACHKGPNVIRAISAAGAHVPFLPPYSPDLNPVERTFAKIEHLRLPPGSTKWPSDSHARLMAGQAADPLAEPNLPIRPRACAIAHATDQVQDIVAMPDVQEPCFPVQEHDAFPPQRQKLQYIVQGSDTLGIPNHEAEHGALGHFQVLGRVICP